MGAHISNEEIFVNLLLTTSYIESNKNYEKLEIDRIQFIYNNGIFLYTPKMSARILEEISTILKIPIDVSKIIIEYTTNKVCMNIEKFKYENCHIMRIITNKVIINIISYINFENTPDIKLIPMSPEMRIYECEKKEIHRRCNQKCLTTMKTNIYDCYNVIKGYVNNIENGFLYGYKTIKIKVTNKCVCYIKISEEMTEIMKIIDILIKRVAMLNNIKL